MTDQGNNISTCSLGNWWGELWTENKRGGRWEPAVKEAVFRQLSDTLHLLPLEKNKLILLLVWSLREKANTVFIWVCLWLEAALSPGERGDWLSHASYYCSIALCSKGIGAVTWKLPLWMQSMHLYAQSWQMCTSLHPPDCEKQACCAAIASFLHPSCSSKCIRMWSQPGDPKSK